MVKVRATAQDCSRSRRMQDYLLGLGGVMIFCRVNGKCLCTCRGHGDANKKEHCVQKPLRANRHSTILYVSVGERVPHECSVYHCFNPFLQAKSNLELVFHSCFELLFRKSSEAQFTRARDVNFNMQSNRLAPIWYPFVWTNLEAPRITSLFIAFSRCYWLSSPIILLWVWSRSSRLSNPRKKTGACSFQ